jgi:hypothetical protein
MTILLMPFFLSNSYMVTLVLHGKFESVQVNFPVAGHTKFGPDGMFGWLGPRLRKFDLYEIEDIVTTANDDRPASYAVEKMDPATLKDFTTYISEHVLKAVNGINSRHGILVKKTPTGATLELRDYSTSAWELHKEFAGPLPPFAAEKLPHLPLSAAKVKDLMRQEKYSPSGKLSYAHFEISPQPLINNNNARNNNNAPIATNPLSNNNTRNNTNANAMDVEEPLPTAPEITMNYGIAYYISTNTGYRPVYAVDLKDGTSSFWLG